MKDLNFSCSYITVKDVEGTSPCGRRATRRQEGQPKCLGHWVAQYLVTALGGTRHALRTWAFASAVLVNLAVYTILIYLSGPFLLLATALLVFCVGMLIMCLSERSLGGVLCLVAAPVVAFEFLRAGVGSFRVYLDSIPREGIPKVAEILASTMDMEVGLIFGLPFWGFVELYWFRDNRIMRFARVVSRVLGVVLFLTTVLVLILTAGRFGSFILNWLVVVFVAAFVARGAATLKRLAKIFQV